jgi:hypothetical protein
MSPFGSKSEELTLSTIGLLRSRKRTSHPAICEYMPQCMIQQSGNRFSDKIMHKN